ncbi:MAG TPA: 30S ribosomal protein S16 [Candidatus Saccharimonadales bacterium]|nr:30S ribosomal protein S16 [Candidatus Saccharimonadales bacterium]
MLTIRMQRVGRSGHAQFRMVVQDSRFHPTSGRVVAYLGNYDPHTKQSSFDQDKLQQYLTNGAQPSPRVVKLLKSQKVKLPEWVKEPAAVNKAVRNPDKRRSTRPEGEAAPEAPAGEEPSVAEAPAEEPAAEQAAAESQTEEPINEQASEQTAAEEQPSDESTSEENPPADEKPAE